MVRLAPCATVASLALRRLSSHGCRVCPPGASGGRRRDRPHPAGHLAGRLPPGCCPGTCSTTSTRRSSPNGGTPRSRAAVGDRTRCWSPSNRPTQSYLVGFAASGPADEEALAPDEPADALGPDVAAITDLLVEPRWGRRGHGSRLLAAASTCGGVRLHRAVAWLFEGDQATRASSSRRRLGARRRGARAGRRRHAGAPAPPARRLAPPPNRPSAGADPGHRARPTMRSSVEQRVQADGQARAVAAPRAPPAARRA